MFDLDRFIEDCRAAVRDDSSHKTAREVLARANADPAAILAAFGDPTRAGVTPLYKSDTLTILNVVWGKKMTIMPHDHRMWAVIGVYTGREDNIFWRRVAGGAGELIEAAGAKSLGERCAEPLGRDVNEPTRVPNRGDPSLWRRFLRRQAQRLGSRNLARARLRFCAAPAHVRGSQRGVTASTYSKDCQCKMTCADLWSVARAGS